MKQYFFLCTLAVCISAAASEINYSFREYNNEQLGYLYEALSKDLYTKRAARARSRVVNAEQHISARRNPIELFGPDIPAFRAE